MHLVLDSYSVHTGQAVRDAIPAFEGANVFLFYLPSYSPELSDIEPIWNAVKHHEIPVRSHQKVKDLKSAVDEALSRKASALLAAQQETTKELRSTTQSYSTKPLYNPWGGPTCSPYHISVQVFLGERTRKLLRQTQHLLSDGIGSRSTANQGQYLDCFMERCTI